MTRFSGIKSVLDRAEQFFFGNVSVKIGFVRSITPLQDYRLLIIARLLVAVAATALVTMLLVGVWYYSKTLSILEKNPEITKLGDKHGVPAWVRVGESPRCGAEECWLAKDFQTTDEWSQVTLPGTDLSSLKDSPNLGNTARIYYRFQVAITEKMRNSPYTLSFSPTYVFHKYFAVYVDGRQIYESRVPSGFISTVNIPLPSEVLTQDAITIAIKGSASRGENGIYHYGGFYIGPKYLLDTVYVVGERSNSSYYLLFAVATGSTFLLLSFFYFLVDNRRGLFAFLVYCLCTTLTNVVRGDFSDHLWSLPVAAAILHVSRFGGIAALAVFLWEYLRVPRYGRTIKVVGSTFVLAALVICIDDTWGMHLIEKYQLFAIADYLRAFTVGMAIVIVLIKLRREKNSARHQHRLSETRSLAILLVIYFCFYTYEKWFASVPGFEKIAVYDLLLFFYMGYLSARRLGVSEQQVTEQRQRIEEMSMASLAGSMTQMFAHDIRRPLSLIRMMTEVVTEESDPGEIKRSIKSYQPAIKEAIARVEGMAADMLNLSLQRALICQPTPLGEILQQTIEEVFQTSAAKKLKLTFDLKHSRDLLVERAPVVRCLHNIIDNAQQATPEGGSLWFYSRDEQRDGKMFVLITIGNSGSFIASAARENIFKPFVSDGKVGGTGLGLAVVRRVTSLHGGTVWCDSSRERGTEFFLLLPASETPVSDSAVILPRSSLELTLVIRTSHVVT